MGKSQETFIKKEREKKRQKKQEDKRLKKEDRKSDSGKGKSWEDMIAYVDEFGRITDTPPDPTKKIAIDVENIMIGIPKEEDREPVEVEHKGTVTFFNNDKGYGFIQDHKSQTSVFVHINQLSSPVKEGDKVTFEVERGPKGLTAVRVKAAK
jgi:cold shock CspA family protein